MEHISIDPLTPSFSAKYKSDNDNNNNIINNKNEPQETHTIYLEPNSSLYKIEIIKNENSLEIECSDTNPQINEVFFHKCSLNELRTLMNVNSFKKAFDFLKNGNEGNCILEPKDDCMILTFNLSNKFSFKLIEKIDFNDALNLIVKLKKENEQLKTKLILLEERITKMDLNCEYNLFNVEAYNLENIFIPLTENKEKILISKRAELGLINKGIFHLFNSNIIIFNLIYDSKKDGEEPENFKKKFEGLIYSIIIIKTKDKKRFGFFCNNSQKNNMQNNNNMNMQMNNIQNNQNNIFGNMMNNNMLNNYMMLNNMGNNNMLNNNIGNNMRNNYALINNQNNNNILNIFSTTSILNDCFAFSFDDLTIYYSSEQKNIFPSIDIKYDNTRQYLFGNEYIGNSRNQINMNNQIYKLSGKSNFNIKKYELFEIQFQ